MKSNSKPFQVTYAPSSPAKFTPLSDLHCYAVNTTNVLREPQSYENAITAASSARDIDMTSNTHGVQVALWASIFTALGTICVALRLWTRFILTKAHGWEDLIIILAWACSLILGVVVGLQALHGLGAHVDTVTQEDTTMLLFGLYLSILSYSSSFGLVKVSILMLYRRIFIMRKLGTICRALTLANAVWTLANLIGATFSCVPIRAFWTREPGARCISTSRAWLTTAALHIVMDIMIVVLPMPIIRHMNLPKKEKWLLISIFALGGVVIVVSMIRFYSLLVMSRSSDPTYDNAAPALISVIEIQVTIICSCLATLRPLLKRCIPSLEPKHNSGGHIQWNQSSVSGPGYGSYPVDPVSGMEEVAVNEKQDHFLTEFYGWGDRNV